MAVDTVLKLKAADFIRFRAITYNWRNLLKI